MLDARDAGSSDRWYVTDGVVAVGPVTYELVLRGVAYGRIPVVEALAERCVVMGWAEWAEQFPDMGSRTLGLRTRAA
ncbi:MAG: hypothetical protein ABJB12_13750 [Pseudomonadota bacterium]